jgi:hypothetical protein
MTAIAKTHAERRLVEHTQQPRATRTRSRFRSRQRCLRSSLPLRQPPERQRSEHVDDAHCHEGEVLAFVVGRT